MTSTWNSSTGATNEASSSTYTEIGTPRLPALTYEDASPPAVSSAGRSRQRQRASPANSSAASTALPAVATSAGDTSTPGSASARVSSSSAGVATT